MTARANRSALGLAQLANPSWVVDIRPRLSLVRQFRDGSRTGSTMVSKIIVGAALVTAAIGTATICRADPPSGEVDVPGIVYGAVIGAPCSNWNLYIFGRTATGQAVACVSSNGASGKWVMSSPLRGVQRIGTPCGSSDAAAQAADGRALICEGNQGWQPGP
jgi:hypothetical protein